MTFKSTKLIRLFFYLVITNQIAAAGCTRIGQRKEVPLAKKGVLDLTDWNFETDGSIDLSGEYEFYWQQHISPDRFTSKDESDDKHFVNVPGNWNGTRINDNVLEGQGYATYRLKVFLKKVEPLAFKLPDIGTAYTLYVNGENLTTVGTPGATPETTVPQYLPQVVDFTPKSNQLDLIFHVSNFHHRSGGLWLTIQLGLKKEIHRARETALFLDLFLLGSITIIGLYHIGLFSLRKNDAASLYFGLFCFLIAIRLIATVEIFLVYLFPAISWELLVKLDYLSSYLGTPVFAMFLYSLFKEEFPDLILRIIQAFGLVFSGIVIFSSPLIFSYTIQAYQIIIVSACVFGFYLLIQACLRKKTGAKIVLSGFSILFAAILNDILDHNNIIQTGRIVPFGLFVFIFSQAYFLSFRFSKAFSTIDLQRLELKKTNARYKEEVIERKRIEKALRKSEEQYQVLYDNNPSMYFTVDKEGHVLSVNKFGAEQLGYKVEELIGQPVLNVFHEKDKCGVLQQLKTCLYHPNQTYHWEFRKIRKDGNLIWVEEDARAVQDTNGRLIVLIVCNDITARKQTELMLRESDKLIATGRMAARIAHEINNPLAGIRNSLRLVGRAVPQEHRHFHYVGKIEKEIDRIASIVRQMLELHRPGQNVPQEFHIEDCIQDIISLMKLSCKERQVKIELSTSHVSRPVTLPEILLRQILYNLIQNAIEASPEGGMIDVSVKIEKQNLLISVFDQGDGISEEVQSRIFEPFFTTKENSKSGGYGLGLSVCKSLVEAMKGKMSFGTQMGKGTKFTITLPLDQSDVELNKSGSNIIRP